MSDYQVRADRILDAAGDLLLRFGHRKVTIEDIAQEAGIGKGTVYLHWRTKAILFRALFMRESIRLIERITAGIRDDPDEVIPHRFVATSFRLTHERPLLRGLFTGDTTLIGAVKNGPQAGNDMLATDDYYDVMMRYGLLRDDVENLPYALQAAGAGFFVAEHLNPFGNVPDVDAKARALAHTVRHAFEPPNAPDSEAVRAAADEICEIFDRLVAVYRKWIYEHDPEQPG